MAPQAFSTYVYPYQSEKPNVKQGAQGQEHPSQIKHFELDPHDSCVFPMEMENVPGHQVEGESKAASALLVQTSLKVDKI